MIDHLIEELNFYLIDRAYHRMVGRKYPDMKEICDKNAETDTSIVLQIKNQIWEEQHERENNH